ncbi:MAG: thioredoxin-disulfide reductase [Armatimonadetes bacterium]|nr:thioredoxin-disulfide reductase [Armatimonadota bacterium]
MDDVREIIILGAGCAGWTAAIYTARANLNPLLFTGDELGGQLALTTEVENYPGFPEGILGPELTGRFEKQARRFGTEVKIERVTGVDFSGRPLRIITRKGEYAAKSVIICTGSAPRKLDVPGETELWGKGVTACATCDGAFFREQEIAVVGGGDTAAEEATFLTRFASKVYLVHRRDRLRASDIMAKRVMDNAKIEPVWNSVVTECLGDRESGLTGLRLKNVENGEASELPVTGFFLAIGHVPNTQIFDGQVELDQGGYVVTDSRQRTNVPGVFAAGDVQDHVWQQAVTAAGTGCAAALAAEKFLDELAGEAYPGAR